MKQKFKKYSFVKVADEMPHYMSHFEKGFIGIVEGTYAQLYGHQTFGENEKDHSEYSLYQLEGNKIVNEIAWYDENQLELISDSKEDIIKAKKLIKEYEKEF